MRQSESGGKPAKFRDRPAGTARPFPSAPGSGIWRRSFPDGMFPLLPQAELLGAVAACITSLCWLPQLIKILRDRRAADVSLATNAAFALGVALWLAYGVMIGSWPVIASNAVTLGFTLAIVGLKLRYG